ncbi:MAG TPA: endolytic transglycosylase MltG [Chitinophagaceae bacterium]|nr:endolytic transglycosylase MltG [Chitinophagaceae bacterium]
MKKKILTGSVSLVILLLLYAAWSFLGPTVKMPEKKFFYVHTGETFTQMEASLHDSKIISGKIWFKWVSKIIGYKTVKPGRYEIKKGMNLLSLVRMLKNGQQSLVNFVITKIRTKEILASKIGTAFECDSLQMISYLNNPDSLKQYGLDTNTAIIAAMPFTYAIKWNTTAGKIFQHFFLAYKTFWTAERKQKAENRHLTPAQVCILASIIEEETNLKSDKPKIASVYLNRIAKGMTLQADPTIKFALKDFSLKRIYNTHLKVQSPYNTYINKGLPPGPICTPSVETIEAVLDAPLTNYLYFVANSNFDGSSVFSSTYEQHMKNAKAYQQALNKIDSLNKK